MSDDMDCSEDPVVIDIAPPQLKREKTTNYTQIAEEYRRNNWGAPHAPFHNAFLASTKQDTQQAYSNAFQTPQRSGGFKSLFVNTQLPEKEKEKQEIVILKKSETEHLSPTTKNRLLWESFD